MSSFTCPHCNTDIIDSATGYITGCEHYPIEDFTDQAGKYMSDGMSQEEADLKAFRQMTKGQEELFPSEVKSRLHDEPQ